MARASAPWTEGPWGADLYSQGNLWQTWPRRAVAREVHAACVGFTQSGNGDVRNWLRQARKSIGTAVANLQNRVDSAQAESIDWRHPNDTSK